MTVYPTTASKKSSKKAESSEAQPQVDAPQQGQPQSQPGRSPGDQVQENVQQYVGSRGKYSPLGLCQYLFLSILICLIDQPTQQLTYKLTKPWTNCLLLVACSLKKSQTPSGSSSKRGQKTSGSGSKKAKKASGSGSKRVQKASGSASMSLPAVDKHVQRAFEQCLSEIVATLKYRDLVQTVHSDLVRTIPPAHTDTKLFEDADKNLRNHVKTLPPIQSLHESRPATVQCVSKE